jgi:hypothetical protein
MKNKSIAILATAIVICLLTACNKKNDDAPAPGPDVVEVHEGLLSTRTGVPTGNLGDTAYIRMRGSVNTGGNLYVAPTFHRGKNESQEWYIKVEPSGNNYVYLRNMNDGYYLGINYSGGAASGYHSWGRNWPTVDKTPGARNRFIMNKIGDHLTFESDEHRGLFLNSTLVSQVSYSGPATVQEVHFLENAQKWFFLKPF